jgi:FkbM family methyltransferase
MRPSTFFCRPGTQDEVIFQWVNGDDEYRLPAAFEPDDVVIDVGAHIGSFCYAAVMRGARNVIAFEAEPSNYALAVRNLEPYGDRVRLHHQAVWRSDRLVQTLSFTASHEADNTGGGNVVWASAGNTVEAVAFDDVIRGATDGGRKRVKLLKIDCETSEFPILLTSRTLHLIDSIVGEFHECGGPYDSNSIPEHARVPGVSRFTIEELLRVLTWAGFNVTYSRMKNPEQKDTNIGPFFAHRAARSKAISLLSFLKRRRVG